MAKGKEDEAFKKLANVARAKRDGWANNGTVQEKLNLVPQPEYSASFTVKGPGFTIGINVAGEPWAIDKALQDLRASLQDFI